MEFIRGTTVSKNGLGILANKWSVFQRPFMLEPEREREREREREGERKTERVKTATLAAITLHNWLREVSKNWKIYIPKGFIDHENNEVCQIFEVF